MVSETGHTVARTLRTVGAAMFGVRAAVRHKADGERLSPLAVITVAVLFMLLFVTVLVSIASGVGGR